MRFAVCTSTRVAVLVTMISALAARIPAQPLTDALKLSWWVAASQNPIANQIEIEVVNTSGRNISALDIYVDVELVNEQHYPGHLATDLVPSYGDASLAPLGHARYIHFGPLLNGDRMFFVLGPFGDGQSPVAQATMSPRAIVFDDNTAVGDETFVSGIFKTRQDASAEATIRISDIRALASAPDPVAALREFRNRRTSEAPSARADGTGVSAHVRHMLNEYSRIFTGETSQPGLRSALEALANQLERYSAAYRGHSERRFAQ